MKFSSTRALVTQQRATPPRKTEDASILFQSRAELADDDDFALDRLLATVSAEEDAEDDYVPESLASFVKAYDATLEQARNSFLLSTEGVSGRRSHGGRLSHGSRRSSYQSEAKDDICETPFVSEGTRDAAVDNYLSPDLRITPKQNPTIDMTSAEAKRLALSESVRSGRTSMSSIVSRERRSFGSPGMDSKNSKHSDRTQPTPNSSKPSKRKSDASAILDTSVDSAKGAKSKDSASKEKTPCSKQSKRECYADAMLNSPLDLVREGDSRDSYGKRKSTPNSTQSKGKSYPSGRLDASIDQSANDAKRTSDYNVKPTPDPSNRTKCESHAAAMLNSSIESSGRDSKSTSNRRVKLTPDSSNRLNPDVNAAVNTSIDSTKDSISASITPRQSLSSKASKQKRIRRSDRIASRKTSSSTPSLSRADEAVDLATPDKSAVAKGLPERDDSKDEPLKQQEKSENNSVKCQGPPSDRLQIQVSHILHLGDIDEMISPIATQPSPHSTTSPNRSKVRQALFSSQVESASIAKPEPKRSNAPPTNSTRFDPVRMGRPGGVVRKTATSQTRTRVSSSKVSSRTLSSSVNTGTSASQQRSKIAKARAQMIAKKSAERRKHEVEKANEARGSNEIDDAARNALINRLMRATAASQAKDETSPPKTEQPAATAKETTTSTKPSLTRLTRATSTSRARSTMEKDAKPFESGTDQSKPGRTSAPARVRKTQTREKQPKQSNKQPTVKKQPSVKRKSTVADKIAAARERVRLQQEMKEEKMRKLQEKEELATKSIAAKKAAAKARLTVVPPRAAEHSIRKVTVPESPDFATTRKLGAKKNHFSDSGTSLAQSTDVLKRGLRGDPSPHRTEKTTTSTATQAPHPRIDSRYGAKTTVGSTKKESSLSSLAQSNDVLRRGLRSIDSTSSSRRVGPTVPQSPKLHKSAPRELPKSTAEREEEIMTYYQSHPFKAAPVMKTAAEPGKQKKTASRPLTRPVPFKLHSDRGPNIRKRDSEDESDSNPGNFKFQARPMPNFAQQPLRSISRHRASSRTSGRAVSSGSATRQDGKVQNGASAELQKRFRARPLPRTTYEYKPPAKSPLTKDLHTNVRPPKLATSSRVEKRSAVTEASRQRAQTMAAEREARQHAKQRKQHEEALRKSKQVARKMDSKKQHMKPFDLEGEKRHLLHLREAEERRRNEETELRKQQVFHARPFRPSPPPTIAKSPRAPTHFEPFNVSSEERRQIQEEKARQRAAEKLLEERAEQQKLVPFRARPVPASTYVSPSPLSSPSGCQPSPARSSVSASPGRRTPRGTPAARSDPVNESYPSRNLNFDSFQVGGPSRSPARFTPASRSSTRRTPTPLSRKTPSQTEVDHFPHDREDDDGEFEIEFTECPSADESSIGDFLTGTSMGF